MIILFDGENFIPEFEGREDGFSEYKNKLNFKYSNTFWVDNVPSCPNYVDYCTRICSGRNYFLDGSKDYEKFYQDSYIPSRHFTFIFNTFVMLQIFNFMNARRIRDEMNIFSRIFSNILFPIIVVGIVIFQIILVTFGSIVFYCYSYYGLTVH